MLTLLPLPPRTLKGFGKRQTLRPVSVEVMTLWVSSHNDWVALWNTHEASRELPLNPAWKSGTASTPWVRGGLTIHPQGNRRSDLWLKARGWDRFEHRGFF